MHLSEGIGTCNGGLNIVTGLFPVAKPAVAVAQIEVHAGALVQDAGCFHKLEGGVQQRQCLGPLIPVAEGKGHLVVSCTSVDERPLGFEDVEPFLGCSPALFVHTGPAVKTGKRGISATDTGRIASASECVYDRFGYFDCFGRLTKPFMDARKVQFGIVKQKGVGLYGRRVHGLPISGHCLEVFPGFKKRISGLVEARGGIDLGKLLVGIGTWFCMAGRIRPWCIVARKSKSQPP
jgi:hypothetical protein